MNLCAFLLAKTASTLLWLLVLWLSFAFSGKAAHTSAWEVVCISAFGILLMTPNSLLIRFPPMLVCYCLLCVGGMWHLFAAASSVSAIGTLWALLLFIVIPSLPLLLDPDFRAKYPWGSGVWGSGVRPEWH